MSIRSPVCTFWFPIFVLILTKLFKTIFFMSSGRELLENCIHASTKTTIVAFVYHVIVFTEKIPTHLIEIFTRVTTERASYIPKIIILLLEFLKVMRYQVYIFHIYIKHRSHYTHKCIKSQANSLNFLSVGAWS